MSIVEPNYAYQRGNVSDRLQMWIDGVGGYTLLLADRINIGQAMASAQVDIPIMGDISRRHAAIKRSGDEYIVDPLSEVKINDQAIVGPALLKHGNVVTLGRGVKLQFTQPHPLSTSAVLRIVSRHRTEPACDGVVLLADSLLMGPKANNHIVCPNWQQDLVVYRYGSRLQLKSKTPLYQSDSTQPVTSIKIGDTVQGEEISFCLERLTRA
ncbi:FHA domain-containing protein [bacterium]|nr:FHA domain-containing protein [bacterium]